MRPRREHELHLGVWEGEKDIFVLCPESIEVNWVVPKAVARKGRGDRFGSRCRGLTRRKSELQMVSAARMRPGRGLLALHSLPPHSPGQIQAGLSAGKTGAGASEHRWLRGQGLGAEEGRKRQPQLSPHPTFWAERIGLVVLICQGPLKA